MAFKMRSNPMKRNFGIKSAKESEQHEYASRTRIPGISTGTQREKESKQNKKI